MLEGSVRKSGDRVRITAQLIDVSDGAHMWSETYDRTITDVFAVQDDVAAAIIDALQIHVGTNPTRGRPTENTEAYALFLKAKASIHSADSKSAQKILLQAIELDPNFAEAYESLAYVHWFEGGWLVNAATSQKLTYDNAAKAIAIDPNLVLARAMFRISGIENYSYLGVIEALEQGVREQPGSAALLETLIWYRMEAGYFREALVLAERFVDLEPLMPVSNYLLVEALYAVGRDSESFAALKVFNQLSGGDVWVNGNVSMAAKQYDIAVTHYETALEQLGLAGDWVGDLVIGARDAATGQAYLDSRIPEIIASMPEEAKYNMRGNLILWYLLFGFQDRHFELIFDLDPIDSGWTDADVPLHDGSVFRRLGFMAHPKYLDVVASIGIVDLWEQRGPPDFCEKVDGNWICE